MRDRVVTLLRRSTIRFEPFAVKRNAVFVFNHNQFAQPPFELAHAVNLRVPRRVEVESTSDPVAEISSAGVIIAVKNSMVEFRAFGLTLIKSEAISILDFRFWILD
jgi:hypothetical protein